MSYQPILKYGRLVCPQPVRITGGKYAGREGVVLDDKSGRIYKINITPSEPTILEEEIHEDNIVAIERLSMFTTMPFSTRKDR